MWNMLFYAVGKSLFEQYTIVSYERKPKIENYCTLDDVLKDCIYHMYRGIAL